MQIKTFIGIDISKNTLDITVLDFQGKQLYYQHIENTPKQIKSSLSLLLKRSKIRVEEAVFCMEYTGIYNMPLINYLNSIQARIWMESGSQISKSMGLVRGKNDKVDSSRIAHYALCNQYKVKLWSPPRSVVTTIATLLTQRNRFIKAKKQLSVPVEEQKSFLEKNLQKLIQEQNKKPISALMEAINKIEKKLMEIIKEDQNLTRLYKIVTSVDGVGMVTALTMITSTNEFLNIQDAKKFACYSGVAPFEHMSGTSIRGKTRVSHMANKKMKTLLHMASLAAIQIKGEIKNFFDRKVSEGKSKMSVLNAVRNKIIHRVFACVKQDRIFIRKMEYCLVKP
jgi:transposase